MSILLEALKKSEEQRQLGKAPSIHSPVGEPARGPDGGAQWVPLAMMTLAAIAMAWIGWQQFQLPPDGGAAATPEVAMNESAGESPQTEGQAQSAAAETGAAASDTPAEPVVARRPQMAASAGQRTPVETYQPDTRAPRDTELTPSADAPPADAAVVQDGVQAGPPQAAAAADARAQRRTVQGDPAAAVAPPHVPEPITYWELPQTVRDELPDLHISVLVYAERSADRFVLINGQRFTETEVVEPGVVLEEVRRSGAVFRYRTYRFLVEG